ncbi:MAG: zinc ribbon domain-containing protein [Actinomycetota bacterium]|nr:zinc ribbon domain-containing protein [Actinomycetota bacterium]
MSGRIAGLKERRREVVGKAVWPAIITEDEHRQLRSVLGDRARRTGTSNARVHLLTGMLHCGRCGSRMRPRGSAARQKYVCPPKAEGGCNGVTVGARDSDDLISSLVLGRMDEVKPVEVEDDEEAEVLAAIERDERWLVDLSDAYADDPDSDPLEMRRAGARVRQRLAEARSALAQLRARQQVSSLPRRSDLGELWPRLPLWERRRVVESFLVRVDCDPGTPGRFRPQRLRVEWR